MMLAYIEGHRDRFGVEPGCTAVQIARAPSPWREQAELSPPQWGLHHAGPDAPAVWDDVDRFELKTSPGSTGSTSNAPRPLRRRASRRGRPASATPPTEARQMPAATPHGRGHA